MMPIALSHARRAGRPVLVTAAGVAVGLLVTLALLGLTTADPVAALQGLLTGSVSTPGRFAQWLDYASFLMLTGASVCLVFRAGMFSIGAEGQVFVGALFAGFVALALPPSPLVLLVAFGAAAVGGFVWGALPGLMKAYLGTDEIVTTLMMNYVATFGFAYVLKEFLAPPDAGFPVSTFFAPSTWFPRLGSNPGISATIVLGLLACVAVSVVLNRTRFGYALRMVGNSPRFAHAIGLRVPHLVWLVIAISGAIAGLAGAAIAFGSTHRLILGMATGLGFDGILVALLALNRPGLVPLSALAYGYLRTGADVIQLTANVPREIVVVIQGLVILALAALIRQRERRARATAPIEPALTERDSDAARLHA